MEPIFLANNAHRIGVFLEIITYLPTKGKHVEIRIQIETAYLRFLSNQYFTGCPKIFSRQVDKNDT